ncbi:MULTISPECIES: hypothetical protein [Streptosporangium]|uniref:Uncharacterized protein n=1 Tax=Streptosporangium brasiliense TaxID=47480 RepID=A0ABT9RNE1_9ACTN|nr:hypothetical protein [Streptosporangium brasiliense]MDP9870351.1 hypothetical protein [Streptosporangium brasiliense]
MSRAYVFGPVFCQPLRLEPGSPIFHTAETREDNYPYRFGRCVIIRYGRAGRAIAIGRWTGYELDEDTAILRALQAVEDDGLFDDDGRISPRFERQVEREIIAQKAAGDVDEEWKLITLMDLAYDGQPDDQDEAGEDR